MSLGIVDICDFVRPPLESHEDMNNMSGDWSWPMRMMLSVIWCDLFKGLDRTIGISETVLKDKMIKVHSHTRSLKPLSPTKPQHGRILTLGFGSRSIRPWPMLNRDHHRCLSPLYVPHRHHGVLGQVSCHLSLMTYLSTRRWKKNRWASQGTSEDRHV